MLVNAEYPVILAERAARTEAGLKYMVELAELLQASVVDSIQRMNFPTRHPFNQDGANRLRCRRDSGSGIPAALERGEWRRSGEPDLAGHPDDQG